MESAWVPGGRGKQPPVPPERLLEREILSLPSSSLWDVMGPQTGTSLVFKNMCFPHYNTDEPGRHDVE